MNSIIKFSEIQTTEMDRKSLFKNSERVVGKQTLAFFKKKYEILNILKSSF